jgi:hypothetical protein
MADTETPTYADPRTIHDIYGREIGVVNDARGFVYTMPGMDVELPQPDDARVLEMATMVDPPPPAFNRAAAALEIDEAYRAVFAPKLAFIEEYKQREAQAQAFKDAGYVGDVPPRVAEFASPAGMTTHAATDLILSQAAALHAAQDGLSALRMRKYEVLREADDAAARALCKEILDGIAAVAASLA